MKKPELDPRLFSEDEIESLTRYVRPWTRFKRALRLGTLLAATWLLMYGTFYVLVQIYLEFT